MWKNSSVPYFPFLQFCLSGCHLEEGVCSRLSDPVPPCSQWTHTYHTHTKPTSEAVFQLLTELLSDSQLSRAESVRGGRKHGAPRGPPFACMACHEGSQLPISFVLWESPSRGRTAVRDSFSLKVTARKEVLIWEWGDFSWQLEILPLKGKEHWTDSSFSYWTPHLVNVLASPPWHRLLAELLSTRLVNGNC